MPDKWRLDSSIAGDGIWKIEGKKAMVQWLSEKTTIATCHAIPMKIKNGCNPNSEDSS